MCPPILQSTMGGGIHEAIFKGSRKVEFTTLWGATVYFDKKETKNGGDQRRKW